MATPSVSSTTAAPVATPTEEVRKPEEAKVQPRQSEAPSDKELKELKTAIFAALAVGGGVFDAGQYADINDDRLAQILAEIRAGGQTRFGRDGSGIFRYTAALRLKPGTNTNQIDTEENPGNRDLSCEENDILGDPVCDPATDNSGSENNNAGAATSNLNSVEINVNLEVAFDAGAVVLGGGLGLTLGIPYNSLVPATVRNEEDNIVDHDGQARVTTIVKPEITAFAEVPIPSLPELAIGIRTAIAPTAAVFADIPGDDLKSAIPIGTDSAWGVDGSVYLRWTPGAGRRKPKTPELEAKPSTFSQVEDVLSMIESWYETVFAADEVAACGVDPALSAEDGPQTESYRMGHDSTSSLMRWVNTKEAEAGRRPMFTDEQIASVKASDYDFYHTDIVAKGTDPLDAVSCPELDGIIKKPAAE